MVRARRSSATPPPPLKKTMTPTSQRKRKMITQPVAFLLRIHITPPKLSYSVNSSKLLSEPLL